MIIGATRRALRDGTAREVREDADLSVTEVAEALQVSPSTVTRWECGSRTPSSALALRYGQVLTALKAESRG